MRIDYGAQIFAALALTILIALLLPSSGGSLVAALLTVPHPHGDRHRFTELEISGRLSDREGGHVDYIIAGDGTLLIKGWAADLAAKRPARSVQIFVGGQNAGALVPKVSRPDVSAALRLPALHSSGFSTRVVGKPSDIVKVFAEMHDGSFAELHYLPR